MRLKYSPHTVVGVSWTLLWQSPVDFKMKNRRNLTVKIIISKQRWWRPWRCLLLIQFQVVWWCVMLLLRTWILIKSSVTTLGMTLSRHGSDLSCEELRVARVSAIFLTPNKSWMCLCWLEASLPTIDEQHSFHTLTLTLTRHRNDDDDEISISFPFVYSTQTEHFAILSWLSTNENLFEKF